MQSIGVQTYQNGFDLVQDVPTYVVRDSEQFLITNGKIEIPAGVTVDIAYSKDKQTYVDKTLLATGTISLAGEYIQQIRLIRRGATTGRVVVSYTQGDNPPNPSQVPPASSIGDGEATPNTTGQRAFMQAWNGTGWDRVRAGITALVSSVVGWLNVIPGIKYNATPPVATDGQVGTLQGDQGLNLKTRDMYAARAENNPLQILQTLNIPLAAPDGSWTPFTNFGANATLNMKATGCSLKSIYCHSRDAAVLYFQLFKTATVPSGGAVPDFTFIIPIGSFIMYAEFFGLNGVWSALGWAYGVSTTEHTFTAATAANQTTAAMLK